MNGTLLRARRGPPATVRVQLARFASRHPEAGVMGAAALAWALLLWWEPTVGAAGHGVGPGVAHGSHAGVPTSPPGTTDPLQVHATSWWLMVVAMMGVVMAPRVRYVAQSCLGRIRARATAATVAGALLVWSVVGLLVLGAVAMGLGLDPGRSPLAAAGVWLLVAAYQLSSAKVTALARCHATRVPRGEADGMARLVAGVAYSSWCVVSCGPAMVAMALTGHSPVLMGVLTVGFTAERVAHRPYRAARRLGAAVAVCAPLVAAVGGAHVLV